MLLGGDSLEGFIHLGVVLLAEVIAHLTDYLDDFGDVVVLVEADICNISKTDIGEAGYLFLFRLEDLLQLHDRSVKLCRLDLCHDIVIIALDLDELGKLFHCHETVRKDRALHADRALADRCRRARDCHMHRVADLYVELDVGKTRNILHDAFDESAEFIRCHDACCIADCNLVSARIDGCVNCLIEEFRFRACGVLG